jgi:hypothetical protein
MREAKAPAGHERKNEEGCERDSWAGKGREGRGTGRGKKRVLRTGEDEDREERNVG